MALRLSLHRLAVRGIHRTLCTPGQPAIGIKAEQLLSDTDLQALLHTHKKQPTDDVSTTPDLRLALLQHLSARTGRPVASDAYLRLHTAEEMAHWFEVSLRPSGARPHAREMIKERLEGEAESVDKRIDEETEVVREEFLQALPANLHIDPKTFANPEERRGRKRRKGHVVRMVRESKMEKSA